MEPAYRPVRGLRFLGLFAAEEELGSWEIAMQHRETWNEICQRADCRGRWVALHACRYDEATGQATEGAVVDVDEDLAELCQRVRDSDWKNCAILFCSEGQPS